MQCQARGCLVKLVPTAKQAWLRLSLTYPQLRYPTHVQSRNVRYST